VTDREALPRERVRELREEPLVGVHDQNAIATLHVVFPDRREVDETSPFPYWKQRRVGDACPISTFATPP
jgi:hypothetical protein